MTRLAALIGILLASSSAQACRLHSIWHYKFPQRCPVHATRYVARVDAHPRPHRIPTLLERINVDVSIPLPALTDINWGSPADEETVGRALLRAKMGGQ